MKIIYIIFLSIAFILPGCSDNSVDSTAIKTQYRAVNKNDTAMLSLILNKKEFYGQFEINYNGLYKDSGDVNGIVKGDTLKGTYRYQHYGTEAWHRIPIALLQKDHKLIMGVGSMEIYMNMTFFKKTVPIDYQNIKFIFEKTP